jgi:hypothetical protein
VNQASGHLHPFLTCGIPEETVINRELGGSEPITLPERGLRNRDITTSMPTKSVNSEGKNLGFTAKKASNETQKKSRRTINISNCSIQSHPWFHDGKKERVAEEKPRY